MEGRAQCGRVVCVQYVCRGGHFLDSNSACVCVYVYMYKHIHVVA